MKTGRGQQQISVNSMSTIGLLVGQVRLSPLIRPSKLMSFLLTSATGLKSIESYQIPDIYCKLLTINLLCIMHID